MAEDDVIPFPGSAAVPAEVVAELARQWLAAGHAPQEMIAAISAAAARSFDPSPRELPTLLPRRERPARCTIEVVLDGAKPRIWRRVVVPSDLTLDRPHLVVQAAMGWTVSHLHAFDRVRAALPATEVPHRLRPLRR